MVDSHVAALQDEETVLHHAEAHVAFRVTPVSKLILVQYDFTIVFDRIVLSEHVYWEILL